MNRTSTRPRPPVAGTVLELIERSRESLLAACRSTSTCERYTAAHLGALRSAAALVAARSAPTSRSRPRSVWEMLPRVAPELTEWAGFFADSGRRRIAIERATVRISSREADDLLRQAESFAELVRGELGLPFAEPLPDLLTPTAQQ